MVAWPIVCLPKELGGLGVPDLRLTSIALQTKWLWLQHTDSQRAWSELPIQASREVSDFFNASTFTILGNGRSTFFWTGRWINGRSIQELAPTLASLVHCRILQSATVAQALPNRAWVRHIAGGITAPAMQEYLDIWDRIRGVELSNAEDTLVWRWTADGKFSSRSAYRALHLGSHPHHGCSRIWDTWAPLRVKIFLWLAVRRRQWTADRRRRHGLDANEHCFLCDQESETMDHIVASCSYSRESLVPHPAGPRGRLLPGRQ